MKIYHQQYTIPMNHNGTQENWVFDTQEELLTEQNINEQAMHLSDSYAKWAFASAHYKKLIQLKESELEVFLANAKLVAIEYGKKLGWKYDSEKARIDAVRNHKDSTGKYVYATDLLTLENTLRELKYYQSIIDGAILESLKIKKEMIITIGAQIRAGLGATNLVINK